MAVHKLKTWPEFFQPVQDGHKTFEWRNNDRHYKVGDFLLLQEWIWKRGKYTGREVLVLVTYTMSQGLGIPYGRILLATTLVQVSLEEAEALESVKVEA